MARWSAGAGRINPASIGNGTNWLGSAVVHTTGATPNVKSTVWSEIITATSEPLAGLWLFVFSTSTSGTGPGVLLDVGVGAASEEIPVVSDIAVGGRAAMAAGSPFYPHWMPLAVPEGTRVAVRAQSSVASRGVSLKVLPVGVGGCIAPTALTSAVSLGVSTATSFGVGVAPNASLNTFGAWVEIVASTSEPLRALAICPQIDALVGGARSYLAEVGVDVAGTVTSLPVHLSWNTTGTEALTPTGPFGPYPADVPVGSRLMCRTMCGTASGETPNVAVLGYN